MGGGGGVCGEEWRSRWFGVAVVEIAAGKMPDPCPILLEPGDFSTIFVAGDRRFPARDAKITILRLLGNLKKKVEMVRHHSIRQHPAPTKTSASEYGSAPVPRPETKTADAPRGESRDTQPNQAKSHPIGAE